MAKEFEWIGDIRGRGVLLGIELVTDRQSKIPANTQTQKVYDYALNKGLIFQVRGVRNLKNVIRLVPPMTSTRKVSGFVFRAAHAICSCSFTFAAHPSG